MRKAFGKGVDSVDSDITNSRLVGFLGEKYCCYFWFTGLNHLSLGLHAFVSMRTPNVEIHLPFGFFRVGCENLPVQSWDGQTVAFWPILPDGTFGEIQEGPEGYGGATTPQGATQ